MQPSALPGGDLFDRGLRHNDANYLLVASSRGPPSMSIFTTGSQAVGLGAAVALLTGCAGAQSSISLSPQGFVSPLGPNLQAYHILHEFGKSAGDGTSPSKGLIVVKGTFYGTTGSGGSNNYGTVYSITKSGEETVLHSFAGNGDGANPNSELLDVDGVLYGTTESGGADNKGTVFSVTPRGEEKVLHSFDYTLTNGGPPAGGLIDVNGTLYGTTYWYGLKNQGAVYSITPKGNEKLLYSFGTKTNDGENPDAALLDVDGVLYGTTYQGGKYNSGTVFAVTTRGRQHVVYTFEENGFHDGWFPMGGLAYLKGRLYGTTENGGDGSGTIFSVTTNGTEKVLHSFVGSDGSQPMAGLIVVRNILYGTTFVGGVKNVGTVFSVMPTGTETVLHSFSDGAGKNPMARLLVAGGILYGTTYGGYYAHHGNVFSFTP